MIIHDTFNFMNKDLEYYAIFNSDTLSWERKLEVAGILAMSKVNYRLRTIELLRLITETGMVPIDMFDGR